MDTGAIIGMIVSVIIAVFGSTGFWSVLQAKRDKSNKILSEVAEVKKSIKEVDDRVKKLESAVDENEARNCRNRIVSFADDIRLGLKHSKDNYDHILIDIDKYANYCREHEEFKNSITMVSIDKIMESYKQDNFI